MTAFAFAIGAVISILCGAIGMVIATQTNFRTTYCAKNGLAPAFRVAYRAGCAMGFALVSLGLLVLTILILIYKSVDDLDDMLDLSQKREGYNKLFDAIAGYGLGGSFVALFGIKKRLAMILSHAHPTDDHGVSVKVKMTSPARLAGQANFES